MNKRLIGSLAILTMLPIWATASILIAVLLAIPVGRYATEGLMYNISFMSAVGDFGLLIAVLVAATILQRGITNMPRWMANRYVHFAILFASVAVGITASVLTLTARHGQLMDVYHDVIVTPLFLYLAATLLPVIVKYGKRAEIVVVVCCGLLWAGLGWFDFAHSIFPSQRVWLYHHITLIYHMRPMPY